MRILILTSQLNKGAAETLAIRLALNLCNNRIYTLLIGKYLESVKESKYIKYKLKKDGINNIDFLNMPINPSFIDIFKAIIRLKHLIRYNRIEIIETSSLSLGIIASIACFGSKVIHVVGLHNTFNRKHGYKNTKLEIVFKLIVTLRKNTYYYAVSKWVKDSWIAFSGTRSTRIKVISNSINNYRNNSNITDCRNLFCQQQNIPKDSKLLISIGRICPHKRQDFLIESLSKILLENNIYIIFLGEIDTSEVGSEEMMIKISKLESQYKINTHIRYLGYRNDVMEIMSFCDILVHSSITEAFGLVLVEAMSVGLPIVAINTEAIPEIIDQPDNILVEYNDTYAFKNAVLKILNRTNKEKKLVSYRNKIRGLSSKYNEKKRAKIIIEYFQFLINNK